MRNFTADALLAIFPPALQKSPDFWNLAQVAAPEFELAFQAATQAEVLCRVDELPEYALDALAYDLDVFWWRPGASLAEKREGIKQALATHRRLGTTQAVQDAITTYLNGGVVQEWFDYSGDPFHFQIAAADIAAFAADNPAFMRVLDGVKRCSAVMDDINDSYLTDEYNDQLLYTDDSPLTT